MKLTHSEREAFYNRIGSDVRALIDDNKGSVNDSTKKVWYAPNQFESYGDEEILEVIKSLTDGWLAGFGKRTVQFEEQVAKYFGKKYGVMVNSGSSACLLALASLQLQKGTKVITPACTFSTTVAPMVQLGLQPVFCDVGLTTYVPSVEDVINLVTDDVKVIMIPNLIGNKPDWKGLRSELQRIGREDIVLIEDSADTMTYTEETDISTTSFYASHVITAGGSGGMVMFNSEKLRDVCLQFRDWGRIGNNVEEVDERFNHSVDGIPYDFKFLYGVLGYNFKSSEMNSAFGLVQMNRLDEFIATRRAIIERYIENLSGIPGLILPDDSIKPNWLAIPLQHENRLELLTYLENNNIQTRVTFAGNITRHPVYREYLQPFNNADTIMRDGFLLGAHHGMTLDDVDYVCEHIRKYV
jgi:CDP-6-deoxy-D-xylo-4-hexulose-3-dehydrase